MRVRVSRGCRWLVLALVACGAAPAAPLASHVPPPDGPAYELWFPSTDSGSEDRSHVRVLLRLGGRGDVVAASAFSYAWGRITPARLERAGSDPTDAGLYVGEAHERPTDTAEYGLAIVIPSIAGIRSARITPTDAAAIGALTGEGFVRVGIVRDHGLDLDGDGRADLAIAHACQSVLDGMCAMDADLVVRRIGGRWVPARACHADPSCWAF